MQAWSLQASEEREGRFQQSLAGPPSTLPGRAVDSALALARQSQGAEWPCALVTLSQMIHYSWGGASSRTCDTHRWVDSSFVPLSAGHGMQGPGGWGAGKGSKSGNHKYDPKHHFHPSLALQPDRERTTVGLVIRADGGHKVKGEHRKSQKNPELDLLRLRKGPGV